MMDTKSWIWKKKSTQKTTVPADKLNISQRRDEEEVQKLLNDKAQLEGEIKILNEKLSSALSDCNAKDDLVEKHAKMAKEAHAGWEKAKEEAMSWKQEVDHVLQQKVAGEETLTHLDMALKECMQQLRFVREEQEQRIHDAVMKASSEFEKERSVLEEKLAHTNEMLTNLGAENIQLSKALLSKEKLIQDVNEKRSQAEADFKGLMARLESVEKENASLKYEVRVLEKEAEIRNEEREFNRRTADVAHRQHLESVKKIAKLESECQKLRVLVRKRLPGPAAIAKMKNEVDVLSKDPSEARRRKSNLFPNGAGDFTVDNTPDTPSKRINFLTEQLHALEEENTSLKETLDRKTSEYAATASKLSKLEAQLEELSKGQISTEPAKSIRMPHESSLASMSDMGSDDKVSCAESWASALISELEHFRDKKHIDTPLQKSAGVSGIDLMDDFVEMEKLAIVSVDKPSGSSNITLVKEGEIIGPLEIQSDRDSFTPTGKEIVLVPDSELASDQNQDIRSTNVLISRLPSWLQETVRIILKQNHVAQRKHDEILEEIKIALLYVDHKNSSEFVNVGKRSNRFLASNHSGISGCVSQKPPDGPLMDSTNSTYGDEIHLGKKSNQDIESNLSKSICKIIKLIEGITWPYLDYGASEELTGKEISYSEEHSNHMIRVLHWRTKEISDISQISLQTCNDLLNRKVDLEKVAEVLASALEWFLNHCFSLQDFPTIEDSIKKHFDWDSSPSESEMDGGTMSELSQAEKLHAIKEQLSDLLIASTGNEHKVEGIQPNVGEECKKVNNDFAKVESGYKDRDWRLLTETDTSETLMVQPQELEETIKSLRRELETLKGSKGKIENQSENHKVRNNNTDAPLTAGRADQDDTCQGFTLQETELEKNCSEELDSTSHNLELHLESTIKKEHPENDAVQEEKQLQTDREITAASEKLAECQETIFYLGKQLKALAAPRDATLFNKLVSNSSDQSTMANTPNKNNNQRTTLLDKLLAEDGGEAGNSRFPNSYTSPSVLDGNSCPEYQRNGTLDSQQAFLWSNGIKHDDNEATDHSLAIVPVKRKGGSALLKMLWWRRKKSNSNGNSKMIILPFAA
ncbi:hypothetical protein NMG60_11008155 [Bertholletia excelsa]